MSIFGRIKDAIFGSDAEAQETPRPDAPVVEPKARPMVDIESNLDNMPGADRLNWRTSIVDLMKLIGVDSDYESRKALAGELGRADYTGSAEDNVWLHRRVMNELGANGGQVPAEFRD